ncbi:hypothetical protein PGN_1228 [Porphyromonas gingivalis ATCC 33277]|uniref:Uncharacterized protein n=1 Tax=Porphyromonas gingivalis (strain ATCC 33277 / DSM 20709 / CIP 103683 / JCM 12257 / NCTC 11834 / 2561) TaxID=431947 RepID=B2RK52_PORG3|nr:hypothetical protein PGN_1228 [Porphyromonas gingivalis ATCC 33277]
MRAFLLSPVERAFFIYDLYINGMTIYIDNEIDLYIN